MQGDHKLVLVVQNGLKMGKGKIAAQVCNAFKIKYVLDICVIVYFILNFSKINYYFIYFSVLMHL